MSTYLQSHLHTYRILELTSEVSTFATCFLRYTSKHLGDHGGVNVSTASFAHISKFWRSESSNSKLGHLDKEIISSKHLGDHGGVNVSTVSFAHILNF